MATRRPRCRLIHGTAGLAVLAGGLATAAEPAPPRPVVYTVQATADVQVTLPLPARSAPPPLYRTAAGRWEPVPAQVAGDALQVSIRAADLAKGQTLVALDVPAGVDLDDSRPPAVVACTVDGVEVAPAPEVDLGGVETVPKTVVVGIRDERNALAPESLAVSLNGTRLDGEPPAARLTMAQDPRQGEITVSLAALQASAAPRNTLAIHLRDRGLGTPALAWALSFRCAPVFRLPDGTTISVDSVTPTAGWESWQAVVDGKPMNAGDGTTAGKTWLSAETETPHWLRLSFPAPRTVTGVALWWAFYECFRTSVAYEIQTWDGASWVTRHQVQGQTPTQCSRHTFAPVTTTGLRIWQPAGAGHPERAGYLWLAEVEAL